jgi:hypothetical protein
VRRTLVEVEGADEDAAPIDRIGLRVQCDRGARPDARSGISAV